MTEHLETLLYAMWSRAGVMFGQPPADASPDIESMTIRTVSAIADDPRLADVAHSWLCRYHLLVSRHRLRRMAIAMDGADKAILGLLLESVRERTATDRFNAVIELCEPARRAGPLYRIYEGNPTLLRLAERSASDLSRKWRRWAPAFEMRADILRPAWWVIQQNPTWRERADLKGDLRAAILEELRSTPAAGDSELALARHCGVTRSALRTALVELELSARIQRTRTKHRTGISLLHA